MPNSKPTGSNPELFDDNFHEWLEVNGVALKGEQTIPNLWEGVINLNQLKAAILELCEQQHAIGIKNGRFGYISRSEAERKAGQERYMVASGLLATMAPLVVHSSERGFPEMTAEVIKELFDEVKKVLDENGKHMRAASQDKGDK